jgi:flagellar motor switch protein FliN/FliY
MEPTAHELELPALTPHAPAKGASAGLSLGFLNNLRVQVSVRLGEAELNVGPLLDMKPGELLALDRGIDQPVDVMVDGIVVARGTLVAVGDHFGVRLTEAPTLHGTVARQDPRA